MITAASKSISDTFISSYGPMCAVAEFMTPIEIIKLQSLNHLMYDRMIP